MIRFADHKIRNRIIAVVASLICVVVVITFVLTAFLRSSGSTSEVAYAISRMVPLIDREIKLPKAKMDRGRTVGLRMASSTPPPEVGNLTMYTSTWFRRGGRFMVSIGVQKTLWWDEGSEHGEAESGASDTDQADSHRHDGKPKNVAYGDADMGLGDTKDLPDVGCSLTLISLTAYAHVPPPSDGSVGGYEEGDATVLVTPYQKGPVMEESANITPDGSKASTVKTVKAGSITDIGDLVVFAPYTLDRDEQGYSANFCVQDHGYDTYQHCMPSEGITRLRLGETKTYTNLSHKTRSVTLMAFAKSDGLQAFTLQIVRQ